MENNFHNLSLMARYKCYISTKDFPYIGYIMWNKMFLWNFPQV